MNKTFSQLEKGDKVYVISIQNSKFEHEPGEPIMRTSLVDSKSKGSFSFNSCGSISMTLDNRIALYPGGNDLVYVFNNSFDTTGYSKVNSTVYATNKADCINTAMELIMKSDKEQRKNIERLSEIVSNNQKMVSILREKLKAADVPDTVEELASMAL